MTLTQIAAAMRFETIVASAPMPAMSPLQSSRLVRSFPTGEAEI